MSKTWRKMNIRDGTGLIEPKQKSNTKSVELNDLSKTDRARIDEIKQNKSGISLDSQYKEFWED